MSTTSRRPRTVACAARPNTSFVHVDAPCECFFGGPAPVHAPLSDEPAGDEVGRARRLLTRRLTRRAA